VKLSARRISTLLALSALLSLLVSCSSASSSLAIDLASSLSPLKVAFSSSAAQLTGAPPAISTDGTSTLVRMILEGKRSDILVSADADSITALTDQHLIEGQAIAMAQNRLVLAVPAQNPGNVRSLDDLARRDIRAVQCAATVPCGRLATAVLSAAQIRYTPLSETANVSAAAKMVSSGEAQAALIYFTDVQASGGTLVVVEDSRLAHAVATITGVVLASSTHAEAAHQLLNTWASASFRPTWLAAGFIPLEGP
jgi:molybdate transport system substrate-binding protein